ncbi:MAG: DUF899 family protein [Thermodesulfobacteriota bacterium]
MSDNLHNKKFPNESLEYRRSRNNLLKAEMELRENIEKVAKLRRELPLGGKIKENYIFKELVNNEVKQIKLFELFESGKDTLIIYSFMYSPEMEKPCPACTSIIDGFNGYVHHLEQRINFAVVAKSPIKRIMDFAKTRNWNKVRFLSTEKNSFNSDYFAETEDGSQMPMCDVFIKNENGIYHFWGSELLYAPTEGDPRHVDFLWPIWNFLDLTPEGRGSSWYPKLSYD